MPRTLAPLLLLLATQTALAVQDCDLNGAPVNPANGYTTDGKTGMMRCRDRDSGRVEREEELRNGRFVGLVRYYKDGHLEKEYSINDKGNREGRAREFYPDGRVALEETYRNGSVIGISRSWFPSGALKRIGVRDDDEREIASAEFNERRQLGDLHCANRPVMGKDVDDRAPCGHGASTAVTSELYSDDGVVRARVSHLGGQRVASESLWENGKPRDQQEMGKDVWVERNFSHEGVKRHETRWTMVDGRRIKQSEQEFHESGSLVHERRWEAGELASEKTFFLNGQMKTEDHYAMRDGRRVCDSSEFRDNGKPLRQGTYLASNGYPDQPVGTHRSFAADGRLRSEQLYDAQGRLTREREFDETGRAVRDDAVFEDGSRKAYAAPAR